MGIPLGHKLKIMKRIKDIRSEQGMTVPQSPALSNGASSKAGMSNAGTEVSYGEGASSRPATKIQYEELPAPTEMSSQMNSGVGTSTGGILKTKESSKKTVTFKSDNDSNVGIPLLKEGTYNEEESHEGFLNALNAWRNAGKKDKGEEPEFHNPADGPAPAKKVKTNEIERAHALQQDTKKKGSFFANIDKENNDFNLGAIPTWQEGGT